MRIIKVQAYGHITYKFICISFASEKQAISQLCSAVGLNKSIKDVNGSTVFYSDTSSEEITISSNSSLQELKSVFINFFNKNNNKQPSGKPRSSQNIQQIGELNLSNY